MLEVKIKKRIGDFVLDLSFDTENDILGLIGPSGSGKSMALKCIAGIEKPDVGKIVLNGRVLFDSENKINLKPQDRRIAYLFQNYALFPNMNVWNNIFVSVNSKYKKQDRIKKVEEIIKKMNLSGFENSKTYELSGGQQQRVALARILVNEPDYLLLDEPFSSLDSFLKWNLVKELKNAIAGFDKGVIFVSHNINEVYYLCKCAIIISSGNEIERGTIKEIIDNPKNEITKQIVKYSDFTRKDIDSYL